MSSASTPSAIRHPRPFAVTRNARAVSAHAYKRRYRSHSIHLNIIPLVDVTFLLMIFFVIAGTFEAWEGVLSSRIMSADPTRAIPLPISPVTIRLTSTGVSPGDFSVSVDGVSRTTTKFDELAAILGELRTNPAFGLETPVVILSDGTVRWDHVVNAWNAAVVVGYRNVAFGTT